MMILTQYFLRIFVIGSRADWLQSLTDPLFARVVLATTLIAAAGYVINDYYDIKIDTINKPSRVFIGRILTRRKAMFLHTFLNFIGIALGTSVSIKIGVICFICAFLLWLYSNQLKRMLFIGNLCVAALTSLCILIIGIYVDDHYALIYIYSLFAFGTTVIREIIKDIQDLKGDKAFGCKTLPIVWGIRKTKYLIYFLISTLIISTGALIHLYEFSALNIFLIFLLVPVLYLAYRLYNADTVKEFAWLSSYCKAIMLAGILGIYFV
ncbi:4-hydroxybenzoate polyprenyltransferase [Sediminitomix flava]|uniref:4-hydroxybenzoate polyprenyltransferase n=2 Tax=Sediminitomix flava TaxID=379075 RepID=A0A315Z6B5_SEDFL|nr:4-hydroxybenzoate polyprenyltransferase [Sediminitomix flava]